jgi:hypothetical protein
MKVKFIDGFGKEPEHQNILKPLSPNEQNFDKIKIYGFDIETYSRENKFLFASLINDDGKNSFYSEKELYNFLTHHDNYGCIIVATNLQFDFFGSFMGKYADKMYPMVRNSRLISAKLLQYDSPTRKEFAKFYDTMNLNPSSVKRLGKSIGIQKIPYPPNFIMSKLTDEEKDLHLEPKVLSVKYPKNKKEWRLLRDYCHNDAFISYKWFKDVYLESCMIDCVKSSFTSASHSLKNFRTNYLDEEIKVNSKYHHMIKSAYFGGRTECVKRGLVDSNKKISYFDVNSLYPSCMLHDMPHPNYEKYIKQCTIRDILEYEGCTYVEGYQEERYITLLPYKAEINGSEKLIFPYGFIKGYYMNIELREAMNNGFEIHKFGDGLIYTKTKKFFHKFITDSYNKRLKFKKENNPLESMEKLKMNSLYGKFGFNYDESTTLIPLSSITQKDFEGCVKKDLFSYCGYDWIQIVYENGEPTDYSIPIWSAQITALARLTLFKMISNPQIQKHLCYMDTDSIFLKDGMTIPTSDKLGDFKLEKDFDSAIFVKPKFYFTSYAKIKGVNSIRTKSEFMKVLHNKVVTEDTFVRFTTAIKSKPHHKSYGLKVNQIVERTKEINLDDDKRNWFNKNFDENHLQDSKPLFINEKGNVICK